MMSRMLESCMLKVQIYRFFDRTVQIVPAVPRLQTSFGYDLLHMSSLQKIHRLSFLHKRLLENLS